MTKPTPKVTRIPGHGLRHEGRYWNGVQFVSAGAGQARCECGERSPVLRSTSARRAWHREHKRQIELTRELKG